MISPLSITPVVAQPGPRRPMSGNAPAHWYRPRCSTSPGFDRIAHLVERDRPLAATAEHAPDIAKVVASRCRAARQSTRVALSPSPEKHDMQSWEVGGGRAPRQPGQVRKEAAAVSFRPGRCVPASHRLLTTHQGAAAAAGVRPVCPACSRTTSSLTRPPRRTAPACSATRRPTRCTLSPTGCSPASTAQTSFNDLIGQKFDGAHPAQRLRHRPGRPTPSCSPECAGWARRPRPASSPAR